MEFRLIRADEIECRVGTVNKKGCSILLFKDARVDMNILDETVGVENWQRGHEVVNGNLFCSVGIWVDRRGDGYGEWVWKQDVGTESYTEKEKGEASDSFKRACFNLGIGRELYTAPFIWFNAGECNVEEKNGKWTTNDRFKVMEVNYDGRRIHDVTIMDNRTGTAKTFGEVGAGPKVKKNTISKKEAEEIRQLVSQSEYGSRSVLTHFKVKDFTELSPEEAEEVRKRIGE